MSFMVNQTPRPYLGEFRLSNGQTITAQSVAFDVQEAMMQMIIDLSGKGFKDPVLVTIGPDIKRVEADAKLKQQEAAENFVSGALKKINQ